jgi:hypothetical protein
VGAAVPRRRPEADEPHGPAPRQPVPAQGRAPGRQARQQVPHRQPSMAVVVAALEEIDALQAAGPKGRRGPSCGGHRHRIMLLPSRADFCVVTRSFNNYNQHKGSSFFHCSSACDRTISLCKRPSVITERGMTRLINSSRNIY